MALGKKQAAKISKDINSLLCYTRMVEEAHAEKDYKKMRECMNWFNDAADQLISLGIPVVKYRNSVDQ